MMLTTRGADERAVVFLASFDAFHRAFLNGKSGAINPLAAHAHVSPLNNPDPFRSNLDLAEKRSKDEAGGLRRLPLLLFDLGIWLIQRTANRQGASVENVGVNVACCDRG